jgi:fatty acid desaturase
MNSVSFSLPPEASQASRNAAIKQTIVEAGERIKAAKPWLRHQNTIGAALMVFAVSGMVASGFAWYAGLIPAWLSIPLAAFCASIIHELEHDLIHLMYFRKQPLPHNLMLALCWLTRPLTINPWLRRKLHFHHHKHSGTEIDLEERAITNGEPMSLRRLLMMFDGMLSVVLRLGKAPRDRRKMIIVRSLVAYFPLGLAAWATWYCFLGFHGSNVVAAWLGTPVQWSAATLARMQVVDVLTVVLLAPNLLRSFCINFVSSNMHYYGDIEEGNVIQQTQVLNPWWMTPFQLFCFNFGSTHAIHHFVVGQPFYLRQMVASAAHPVMREMGVRFNDVGTFGRANRWQRARAPSPAGHAAAAR